ncbi:MAG TPA: TrkA family potassium uptake protein [Ruminiclostridium sp.]|jgi:trk system potassium uptake protein TrkA|uniref:Potassium transporter TrkA n=1 Tax=Acetivibrio saccincola TaxID=1677857 RepID=A0A2K9E6E2_9FIRM|nr:TrkA family potassium uptake protein [Acetivibrio saccincola]HAA43630.1 TrkA family potassium uptake protein [Ruminiclostridium sp.]AUG57036.1 Trk system potassium uptake protein TrkA [Acetivibrio saccincola]NLW25924.1 TrkA family potassium uptake protein [Acetivibrio saccincola]PQQ67051.1 potassium transporter TrkA [Acetivibrio saccincola]HQD28025.1 TrkA family potassium uptake protein [Acetivibrio saccincola]
MHVIIIGCGKVGSRFANVLSEEGHDVVIIDSDSNSFKLLSPDFNGITLTGVPIDQDVLKKAGINTADALAAVTPDDNINIMVCQVAKEIFKVPKVIARIYDPSREHVFHHFGLETICPTDISVNVIKSIIIGKKEVQTQTIGNKAILYRQERVDKSYIGKKVEDIELDESSHLFAVIRDNEFNFAKPGFVLKKGDEIVIASKGD